MLAAHGHNKDTEVAAITSQQAPDMVGGCNVGSNTKERGAVLLSCYIARSAQPAGPTSPNQLTIEYSYL